MSSCVARMFASRRTKGAQVIAVTRASTRVTDAEVATMVRGVDAQVNGPQGALARWGRPPGSWSVRFFADPKSVPAATPTITLYDTPDQGANYIGYHTEDKGIAGGNVYVSPVLDHGGTAVQGPFTVASVLSHEVLELLADPAVQTWAQNYGETGQVLYAWEVCDPVENDSYDITFSDGTRVSVSNYVTLAWFDAQNATGPYDRLGKLNAPFTMTKGGYVVKWTAGGNPQEVFGDEYPAWKIDAKRAEGRRTQRRVGSG